MKKQYVRVSALIAIMGISFVGSAVSQPVPTAPVAVVNQQDLSDLNTIITDDLPPRWAKPVIDWMNKLVTRQRDEDAKKAAAADKDKGGENK